MRRTGMLVNVTVGVFTACLALAIVGCPPKPPDPPTPPEPGPPAPKPTVSVYIGVYDLMGAVGDVPAFLDAAVAAGACGVRVFVCYSWQGPQSGGSPYVQVGTWTHDSGRVFPLYRLSAWNEPFWDRFNSLLCAVRDRGLTAWVVVEDFCSLKGDQSVKYYNPMVCSEEALGPSTPGGVWGEDMKQYHEALIDRSVAAARAVTGLSFMVEPMNEYDALDWPDDYMVAWHAWAVSAITSRGVPLSSVVGTAGRNAAAVAGQVGVYSPHGIGRPDQVAAVDGVQPGRMIYSSDGFWGGTGPADCKGKRGPGLDVAAALGRALLSAGALGFEYLPRDAYLADCDRAHVDGLDWSVVQAMAFAR